MRIHSNTTGLTKTRTQLTIYCLCGFYSYGIAFRYWLQKEAENDPEPTKPWNPTAYELIRSTGFSRHFDT